MSSSLELINEYSIKPNKALGQNFLIDEAAIGRIAAAASEPGLPVIEIGPGLGAITLPLAETGLPIAAVELDRAMCDALSPLLPENVRLIHSDFLKADLDEIHASLGGGDICFAGNLPYYVTSPICMRLVTCALPIKRMVLMMQKEAADRFFAAPGDKNYVPLSVLAQLKFDISRMMELSPASYRPRPDVDSCVLLFESRNAELPDGLPGLLKCAFAARRKTLVNNLCSMGLSKAGVAGLLESAGISPSARAETLSPRDFEKLCRLAHSRE